MRAVAGDGGERERRRAAVDEFARADAQRAVADARDARERLRRGAVRELGGGAGGEVALVCDDDV